MPADKVSPIDYGAAPNVVTGMIQAWAKDLPAPPTQKEIDRLAKLLAENIESDREFHRVKTTIEVIAAAADWAAELPAKLLEKIIAARANDQPPQEQPAPPPSPPL